MQEYKDLTLKIWDTGSPESGEFVLRVSFMVRVNSNEEWTYKTFKLEFNDVDERDECIQHYSKLYKV
jgi:hypothetical protein